MAVRCFLIKIHGIHNRLSDAEASGFYLRIRIKTAAERRIHKISGRERIVDHASDDLFLFPVEIKVEARQLLNAGSDSWIYAFHIFHKIRRQDNFSCDIQPDHMKLFACKLRQLGKRAEYFGCGIRVAPVIVLGNRGAVSMALIASAHGDKSRQVCQALRCAGDDFCKVRHRSEGKNGNIRGCF